MGDITSEPSISYTGVLLDEVSRAKLLSHVDWMIPKSYKRIAHHLTVNMGSLSEKNSRDLIGKTITMIVDSWSLDTRVYAVRVVRIKPTLHMQNEVPHITVACNYAEGKPVNSNELTNWIALPEQIELQGTLFEFGFEP